MKDMAYQYKLKSSIIDIPFLKPIPESKERVVLFTLPFSYVTKVPVTISVVINKQARLLYRISDNADKLNGV
jgi:hypothetical protein